MHIDIVPNRNSKPAVLLRESYRDAKSKKPRKRTLANLSKLPSEQVDAIRRILKGQKLVSLEDAFEIVENGSRHHGHVDAVLSAMRQLGFEKLVGSRHSPERDLVVAMVVARILEPQSKLATSLWWHTTTLPEILGVSDADEDDLYAAMDWVLKRQEVIEKKLAARHLHNDGLALYDLTSSYFEGVSCPLARLGYNRDGKKGKLQVNYGLLTNERGIPVSVSVFEGNTGDPKTLLPQVENAQERFGIEQFVMVGDRGMITQTQIDELREMDGIDWITALRPEPIRKLINDGVIQMGLFDRRNLFELTHPDFPNERLVACRNPELAVFRFSWNMTVLKLKYAHGKRSCHEQRSSSSHCGAKGRAVAPARCREKAGLGGMQRGRNPAEPCSTHGKGELLAGAHTVFSFRRAPSREKELEEKLSRLEAKVARKDQIIAEVTEEYVTLKKKLGEA